MSSTEIPALYRKYFVDKNDERRMLFEKVKEAYAPEKGIYPGSFVHITPSYAGCRDKTQREPLHYYRKGGMHMYFRSAGNRRRAKAERPCS